MTKAAIRKKYKQLRLDLSAQERSRREDLMLIQFQQLHLEIPDTFLSYAPIEDRNEYNPILIEEYCFFKNPGAVMYYPVCDMANQKLRCVEVHEDTAFETNEFNIAEPVGEAESPAEAMGLMLVPLLAFDETGHRVGYGKGFYDDLISRGRNDLITIGFSFFGPEKIDDIFVGDKKLHYCITPEGVFEF